MAAVQVIRKWLLRLWHAAVGAVLHVWEFLRRICSSAERPLHFLKVQISVQPGGFLRTCLLSIPGLYPESPW